MAFVTRPAIWCCSPPLDIKAKKNAFYLEQKTMEKTRELKICVSQITNRSYIFVRVKNDCVRLLKLLSNYCYTMYLSYKDN